MIEKNNYCPLFIVSGQRYESLLVEWRYNRR